jgi:hypothetical protein
LFGDFNLISNSNEKLGGRDIHNSPTDLFNETLNTCGLNDLGYYGDIFTWSNNQEEDHNIKERLDRFCASTGWMARFPRHTNYHLMNHMSDHNPILLVFGTHHDFREDSHHKISIKRFENIWLQDQACTQIIKDTWNHNQGETSAKLKLVMDTVYRWGKATWGNIPRGIKAIQTRLQNLNSISPTREQIIIKHQLETNLDTLLLKEELWWSQRAKSNWLQHGDKNSKYFHFKASQRHRKNTINFIQDSQGSQKIQNKDIQEVFLSYFNDIFTSSNPTNIQDTINVVANRISPHMKDYLSQEFTAAEVFFCHSSTKRQCRSRPRWPQCQLLSKVLEYYRWRYHPDSS